MDEGLSKAKTDSSQLPVFNQATWTPPRAEHSDNHPDKRRKSFPVGASKFGVVRVSPDVEDRHGHATPHDHRS